jgi:hypothetical protein
MTLFEFSETNHLWLGRVVDDDDHGRVIALWLSGRLFGRLISWSLPWRGRL